jgi:uncharacterized membrane protein
MRLNGWQRIGIVASVIWIFVGGFWGNNIGIHEGDWAINLYRVCLDANPNGWDECTKTFDSNYVAAVQYHWYYAAFLAFVPIPLAWLIAWGLISLARWIRRGFEIRRSN